MHLRIQRGSPIPISRQIDAQIRAQILAGTLLPEEQLPSVRQLARELAVNVNTVLRVYERLSADGLIELRHGEGTYVSPRRKGEVSNELAIRRTEFTRELAAMVRGGLMLGITPTELRQLLEQSMTSVTEKPASRKSRSQKGRA